MADESTFEDRLRKAIKARGRQNEFAKDMGVRPATVSDWVRGKNAPELSQLLRIVAILDVDAHWLLTGEGEMRPVQRLTAERAFAAIAAVVDEVRAISAGEEGRGVLARFLEGLPPDEATGQDPARRGVRGG